MEVQFTVCLNLTEVLWEDEWWDEENPLNPNKGVIIHLQCSVGLWWNSYHLLIHYNLFFLSRFHVWDMSKQFNLYSK